MSSKNIWAHSIFDLFTMSLRIDELHVDFLSERKRLCCAKSSSFTLIFSDFAIFTHSSWRSVINAIPCSVDAISPMVALNRVVAPATVVMSTHLCQRSTMMSSEYLIEKFAELQASKNLLPSVSSA